VGSLPIGEKPLEIADGNGAAFLAENALSLALDFLRANPPAHGGQGILLPDDPDALGIATFNNGTDEARDGHSHRTSTHAFGSFALDTAGSLGLSQSLSVANGNFKKIMTADICRLFRHGLSFLGCLLCFLHSVT
jgi:hypothetical protein